MLVTHVGDKLNDRSDVPMIIAPGRRMNTDERSRKRRNKRSKDRRTSHNLRKEHSRQNQQKK